MSPGPIVVIADDLTGACEIAALGMRKGLSAKVSTDLHHIDESVQLLVIDTETRLDSPALASARLRSAMEDLGSFLARARVFKKIDSALRGPIAAELEVLAQALRFQRVLVAAANPRLGRTISRGFYRIDGKPLHETDFANDIHHPATSAWVMDLLGPVRSLGMHRCSRNEAMPERGIVVADIGTLEDYDAWREHISPTTLPAGSAAFFEALLQTWDPVQRPMAGPADSPELPLLLISGTTSAAQINQLVQLATGNDWVIPLNREGLFDDRQGIHDAIRKALAHGGRALVFMEDAPQARPENACGVRLALSDIARRFVLDGSVRHLVVEGGATAASVAFGMHWRTFDARREWAQGIVSLVPEGASEPVTFTMKPGSYPWPESIARLLFGELNPFTVPHA